MPPRAKSQAFDLKESQLTGDHADVESYEDLASWLCDELDIALSARGDLQSKLEYYWKLYQQERTRGSNAPWPDAADLTSPFAAEYVDALHARVMQTIFTDPVWVVDGWGESAQRAPFIEEFHQRTQEEERLQSYLDAVLLRAWVEGYGVLESSDALEFRRESVRKRAKWQVDELTGGPVVDEKAKPVAMRDEIGNLVETAPDDPASIEVELDEVQPIRQGPAYDVVPRLDFLTLPEHAKDRSQIWGYAKRFWRRVPELVARSKQGIYDADAVEECGTENERDTTSLDAPTGVIVSDQKGPTAQKELWDVQFLADLDGKGERWYRATVHKDKRLLLRLKKDDRSTRYHRFIPFPKPGTNDGYSLIGDKLITVIEEDTAVRNMRADMAAKKIAEPILKVQGALWDEYEQPLGPRAVITVRDPNEIRQLQFSDVPESINVWKNDTRNDADRLVGQNDTSLGQETGKDATLGEVRLRAGYAEVRMDLIIKRLKEPLEELGLARHESYKRQLQAQAQGMPMPQSMLVGLEARGVEMSSVVDRRITAQMLEGQFWFKPRGSVESADMNMQQAMFNQLMAVLPAMMQVNQMIAAIFQTPEAAKSLIEQMLRVYRWPDKQAFLGSSAQNVIQGLAQQQQMLQDPMMKLLMAMGGGGAAPGAAGPPGAEASSGQPPALPPAMGMGMVQ